MFSREKKFVASEKWKKSSKLFFFFPPHLRDGEASNGETRDGIRTQQAEIVLWTPLENGEEILKTEKQFHEPSLVLESVKRVVGEEYLIEPVLEFLKSGSLRRQPDSVDFQRWWW